MAHYLFNMKKRMIEFFIYLIPVKTTTFVTRKDIRLGETNLYGKKFFKSCQNRIGI